LSPHETIVRLNVVLHIAYHTYVI